MEDNILYQGTIIEFFNFNSYTPQIERFILTDCYDKDFIFQIVSISGFNSGSISGYIKEDKRMLQKNMKAVSIYFLKEEIKRNFGNIDFKTLNIYTEYTLTITKE